MEQLAGKVAIVTGGGHGIGRRIAVVYAQAGARIVLAARAPGPLEETRAEFERAGTPCLTVEADIAREADCARMAERTMSAFGRIDILVNNAGIAGPTARVTEATLAQWQETIDINLTGAWLAARAVLPPDGKATLGPYREYRIGGRPPRLRAAHSLCGFQVGADRSDPEPGA
jgi:NAD(P)-dependent dehydrogenase (short-subunit alcohol dehydrogenase family)